MGTDTSVPAEQQQTQNEDKNKESDFMAVTVADSKTESEIKQYFNTEFPVVISQPIFNIRYISMNKIHDY